MLVTSIFSFSPQCFLLYQKQKLAFMLPFIFNLDKVKFLSSGNGLSLCEPENADFEIIFH